ncbi:MAG: transketolase C-terminal domain-containing protein [Acutalibacteraceae bacterium]
MVQETMKANEILKQEGIDAEIINIHTIKPIDRDAVLARKENRRSGCGGKSQRRGGLTSAVVVLMEEYPVPLRAVGVRTDSAKWEKCLS